MIYGTILFIILTPVPTLTLIIGLAFFPTRKARTKMRPGFVGRISSSSRSLTLILTPTLSSRNFISQRLLRSANSVLVT